MYELYQGQYLLNAQIWMVEFTYMYSHDTYKNFQYYMLYSTNVLSMTQPMKEFADACDIDVEAFDRRRGTISDSSTTVKRDSSASVKSDNNSVESRHLSLSAKVGIIFMTDQFHENVVQTCFVA